MMYFTVKLKARRGLICIGSDFQDNFISEKRGEKQKVEEKEDHNSEEFNSSYGSRLKECLRGKRKNCVTIVTAIGRKKEEKLYLRLCLLRCIRHLGYLATCLSCLVGLSSRKLINVIFLRICVVFAILKTSRCSSRRVRLL